MENTNNPGYPPTPDFEQLQQLYCDNPDEFEIVRQRLLQEAADAQVECHRPGAHRLLAHIELVRQRASTPLEAVSDAFGMMSESFNDLQGAWRRITEQRAQLETKLLIARLKRGQH